MKWTEQATTDPSTIQRWWGSSPVRGIGVVTGPEADLTVLDIDGDDGEESLFDLQCKYEPLPDTIETITGSGGRHLFFHYHQALTTVARRWPGIDVRGERGMVVVPPSLHASGRRYAWELSSVPGETDPASLPEWMARTPTVTRAIGTGEGALDWDQIELGVEQGQRNDQLFRLACRFRWEDRPREEAEFLVLEAAQRCRPPLPEREARYIVRHAWNSYPPGPGQDVVATRRLDDAEPDAATSSSGDQPGTRFNIVVGDDIHNLPPPEWLIENHLVQGSLVLLYGHPGIGKSFLALDMAASVAAGRPWHGHDVVQGQVLYVAGEGVGDLGLRVRAWEIGHQIDSLSEMAYLTETVNLFLSDRDQLLAKDVYVLLHDLGVLQLAPSMIVVDTLARTMGGGDENSAKDMGIVIASADHLRHELGSTVMLIHHSGKDGRTERGSTALIGAVDTSVRVTRKGNGPLVAHCEKQKMAMPFPDLRLRLAVTEVEGGSSCWLVSDTD
ncbi:MAG: AAA family ATPase, partial [Acidimicrobiia bacterium]